MVICHCEAISDAHLRAELGAEVRTVADVTAHCGAGRDCGGCHATIGAWLDQLSEDTSVTNAS